MTKCKGFCIDWNYYLMYDNFSKERMKKFFNIVKDSFQEFDRSNNIKIWFISEIRITFKVTIFALRLLLQHDTSRLFMLQIYY